MSTDFVKKNVDEIIGKETNYPFPLNLAMASTWILGNLKGINLRVFNVANLSSLCDYYVVASASNVKQAKSMSEEIISNLKRNGQKLISCEGFNEADWVLIDLGDVIIHIFLETSRDTYNVEALWSECPTVEIPTSYYFSDPEETQSNSEKSYF